jgi:hypothetical protein
MTYFPVTVATTPGNSETRMIAMENCHRSSLCTQRWESLETVLDNPRVRYCARCGSAVHLVECGKELVELARQGKRVAVLHR